MQASAPARVPRLWHKLSEVVITTTITDFLKIRSTQQQQQQLEATSPDVGHTLHYRPRQLVDNLADLAFYGGRHQFVYCVSMYIDTNTYCCFSKVHGKSQDIEVGFDTQGWEKITVHFPWSHVPVCCEECSSKEPTKGGHYQKKREEALLYRSSTTKRVLFETANRPSTRFPESVVREITCGARRCSG